MSSRRVISCVSSWEGDFFRREDAPSRKQGHGLMLPIGMEEWRHQHPKAPLQEIEEAVDERQAQVRAGVLEEVIQRSPQAHGGQQEQSERPTCEPCGQGLQRRGTQRRTWQTSGGQEITIERESGTCPACGHGLFPPGPGMEADQQ